MKLFDFKKKRRSPLASPVFSLFQTRLFFRAEVVFAYAAEWAYPIFRQVFECYIVILYRVINITAYIAYIFVHFHSSYCLIDSAADATVFVI